MTPIEFEKTVLDAFQYLLNDFGFRYLSTNVHAPECWATFHNSTTAVTVHFEMASQPWVELAKLKHDADTIVETNRSALEFLVQERAPEEMKVRANVDDDEEIRQVIYDKARQLRDYGRDVLQGDFTVFPRLKELAMENLRRRNAIET